MAAAITMPENDRAKISKMLITLFEHWKLSTKDQLNLLGHAIENRSLLKRYKEGSPISNDRDKLERAGILLDIHTSLRILFPANRDLANAWMTTPNRAFNGFTPVKIVEQQGMFGLYCIRTYLNKQRDS